MKIEARVSKQVVMQLTDKEIQSMLKWLDRAVGHTLFIPEISELYTTLMDLENK